MEPKVNKGYPAGRKVGDINRRPGGLAPVPKAKKPEKAQPDTTGSPSQRSK